jgi:hypothetical protein
VLPFCDIGQFQTNKIEKEDEMGGVCVKVGKTLVKFRRGKLLKIDECKEVGV